MMNRLMVVAALAFTVPLAGCSKLPFFNEKKVEMVPKSEYDKVMAELKKLKEEPKTDPQACKVMEPVIADLRKQIGEQCQGKTLVKQVPVAQTPPIPQTPPFIPPGPQAGAGKRDHCIFRVSGEIKSETWFAHPEGEVKCPIWRDQQLALFKQNPNGIIWQRKYPS